MQYTVTVASAKSYTETTYRTLLDCLDNLAVQFGSAINPRDVLQSAINGCEHIVSVGDVWVTVSPRVLH